MPKKKKTRVKAQDKSGDKKSENMEEILSSTKVDMNHLKRQTIIEGVMLSLPLLVSFWFYTATIMGNSSKVASGEMLSPGGSETLLLFLLLFIIVYGLFLVYQYRKLYLRVKSHSRK